MKTNQKHTKAMALLYVVVTVGVLSLAFISITEIGKSRALQSIASQSKSKAYEALDAMMECAMGADRADEGELSNIPPITCGGVTVQAYDGETSYNSKFIDYDMIVGKLIPNSSSCAQAIIYRIDTATPLPSTSGNNSIMIVRGFSSCNSNNIPSVKDPNFATVLEKVSYIDFP